MKYIYTIFILSLAISCNIDEVYVDVYDPVQDIIDSMEQRKTDKNIIYSYLDNNNITSYDTTNSGVFYSVIEEGDSILYPEINDINTARYNAAGNGLQTAGLVFGGASPGSPGIFDETEEYNGTAWTEKMI